MPLIKGFSLLETVLLSIVVAIITALGSIFGMGKKFMTRNECKIKLEAAKTLDRACQDKLNTVLMNQELQFRMLRLIVVNMDIPKEIQSEILTMTPGGGLNVA